MRVWTVFVNIAAGAVVAGWLVGVACLVAHDERARRRRRDDYPVREGIGVVAARAMMLREHAARLSAHYRERAGYVPDARCEPGPSVNVWSRDFLDTRAMRSAGWRN